MTGNVNLSSGEEPTTTDIAQLIDHLFITMTPLACVEEADVTGDLPHVVDIGDLMLLIDHLYLTGAPLANCP